MEENVALDSSKQKKFVKSIKGIKKLIKKNDAVAKSDNIAPIKDKIAKVEKRKRKDRGLVYLAHIPHGFYENEMTQYFKQFGMVTNARVIRSKRTGNSKGYAFVEFREPAVAQIVADTMNNYLMGKRLIKAALIPPEKQKRIALRKNWNPQNNPSAELRLKMKKAYNADKDEAGDLKKAKQLLSRFANTKKRLNELGINYDFFTPVDVPKIYVDKVKSICSEPNPKIKEEKGDVKEVTTSVDNTEPRKSKKKKKVDDSGNKSKSEKDNMKKIISDDIKIIANDKTDNKSKKKNNEANVHVETTNKIDTKSKANKKAKIEKETLVKEPVNNEKLKKVTSKNKTAVKAVKPLEDFIKVQSEESDDSSNYEFDSDEFDKLMQDDDESNSELDNSDDSLNSADDESVVDLPPINNKNKKKVGQVEQQKQNKADKQGGTQKSLPQLKRKAPQKTAAETKKHKFEKQNKQKATNKQFKKK